VEAQNFLVGSTEFFDVEGEAQQRRRSNYFIYTRETKLRISTETINYKGDTILSSLA
jgi:hypothetical protein